MSRNLFKELHWSGAHAGERACYGVPIDRKYKNAHGGCSCGGACMLRSPIDRKYKNAHGVALQGCSCGGACMLRSPNRSQVQKCSWGCIAGVFMRGSVHAVEPCTDCKYGIAQSFTTGVLAQEGMQAFKRCMQVREGPCHCCFREKCSGVQACRP
eukprot:1160282-Pelagomonas_calceolata.AAC.4